MEITHEEVVRVVLEFYRQHGRWPSIGGLRHRFNHKISRQRAALAIEAARNLGQQSLPTPRAPLRNEWPRINAPVLVVADLHIPAQDNEWIEYCVDRAIREGVSRVLIAGDLVDFTHLSKWPAEHHYTAEDELADAVAVVRWFRSFMSEVHIIPGNHDDRLSKRLDRQVSTRSLLEAFLGGPNVHIYWHHHIFVGDRWLIAHPGSVSKVPLAVARDLAATHHRNVAIAHDHLSAIGWDTSGQFICASFGACADPRRLSYQHRELRRWPMTHRGGLIILPDERPILLHPKLG